MNTYLQFSLGTDIAKLTLAMRLVSIGSSPEVVGKPQTFENTAQGHQEVFQWLHQQGAGPTNTQVVMEATGVYWEAFAFFAYEQGFTVCVVNPAQIKYFARTILMRGKTDTMDAELIARFGAVMSPHRWEPPSLEMEHLRLIMRQRDAYVAMMTEETNRLHALEGHAHPHKEMIKITKKHVRFLEQQILRMEETFKDTLNNTPAWKRHIELLMTIPGIGLITAGTLLTETNNFAAFVDAHQLTAYAGLSPAPFLSGTSVRGKTKISKIGNARLRRALYMAALSAIRSDSVFKRQYQRLREQGKPCKVGLVAIARKLALVAFALIQSQQPFNVEHVSVRH